jgi:hypothetical protein
VKLRRGSRAANRTLVLRQVLRNAKSQIFKERIEALGLAHYQQKKP